MKKLYDELSKIKDEDIKKYVKNNYETTDTKYINNEIFEYIQKGIENLKKITPKDNKDIICCINYQDYDIDFKKTPSYKITFNKECFQILNKDLQLYKKDNNHHIAHYDIKMAGDWEEFLGNYIYIESQNYHSYIEDLITIVEHLLYFGNNIETHDKNILEFKQELKARHKEIEKGNCVTLGEFIEEIFDNIEDKEFIEQLKTHNKLWRENEDTIQEIARQVMDFNSKKTAKIYEMIYEEIHD